MSSSKGDLAKISKPDKEHPKITERINIIWITDSNFSGSPTTFWDVFGKQGHPIRTTIFKLYEYQLDNFFPKSQYINRITRKTVKKLLNTGKTMIKEAIGLIRK